MSDLTDLRYAAEQRLCPKGQPWTGDDNRTDHGHTDCYIIGGLLNALDSAEVENAQWQVVYGEAAKQCHTAEARLAAIEGIVHSAIPDADKIAGIAYCLGRKFEG